MSRLERWALWLTSLLVVITGTGLFVTKYLMKPTDPWAVINHPLQPWFLKTHIMVSPFLVLAVGSVTLRHIWQHYRAGQLTGRRSGVTTALVTLPMIASGYLIQVITAVGLLRAMAISHMVLGTMYALGLSVHQVVVQRREPKRLMRDRVVRRTRPVHRRSAVAAEAAGIAGRRPPPAQSVDRSG